MESGTIREEKDGEKCPSPTVRNEKAFTLAPFGSPAPPKLRKTLVFLSHRRLHSFVLCFAL